VNFIVDFVRETISVFMRTAPYLLFGFFLAGAIKVLIPPEWLSAHLGKRSFRSVFLASLIGVPLPLCSCSVVPTAAGLRRSGASKGATVAFLVATPEIGVDSMSVSYALLDPILTVARPAVRTARKRAGPRRHPAPAPAGAKTARAAPRLPRRRAPTVAWARSCTMATRRCSMTWRRP